MKNSNKLMEERGGLVEELESLLDNVTTEGRDFSDTENERQDEIHTKIADLDDAIQRAKNNEAVFAVAAGNASSKSEAKEVEQIRGKFSITKAIQDISNTGKLQGLEAEMAQEGRSELAKTGQSARGNLTIPSMMTGVHRIRYSHQGSGNALFADGHTANIKGIMRPKSAGDVWTKRWGQSRSD